MSFFCNKNSFIVLGLETEIRHNRWVFNGKSVISDIMMLLHITTRNERFEKFYCLFFIFTLISYYVHLYITDNIVFWKRKCFIRHINVVTKPVRTLTTCFLYKIQQLCIYFILSIIPIII